MKKINIKGTAKTAGKKKNRIKGSLIALAIVTGISGVGVASYKYIPSAKDFIDNKAAIVWDAFINTSFGKWCTGYYSDRQTMQATINGLRYEIEGYQARIRELSENTTQNEEEIRYITIRLADAEAAYDEIIQHLYDLDIVYVAFRASFNLTTGSLATIKNNVTATAYSVIEGTDVSILQYCRFRYSLEDYTTYVEENSLTTGNYIMWLEYESPADLGNWRVLSTNPITIN